MMTEESSYVATRSGPPKHVLFIDDSMFTVKNSKFSHTHVNDQEDYY